MLIHGSYGSNNNNDNVGMSSHNAHTQQNKRGVSASGTSTHNTHKNYKQQKSNPNPNGAVIAIARKLQRARQCFTIGVDDQSINIGLFGSEGNNRTRMSRRDASTKITR